MPKEFYMKIGHAQNYYIKYHCTQNTGIVQNIKLHPIIRYEYFHTSYLGMSNRTWNLAK